MTVAVPQADHVRVVLDPAQVVTAYARHRRRFASAVSGLDDAALARPSRCERWTVADVLRHGVDVDQWMHRIWSQQPLPFERFDPRHTPEESVDAGRSVPDTEVRDRYIESGEAMAAEMDAVGPERWGDDAFSPLGPVPWWLSTMHAFYDSWVHERDALLPLGVTVPVESDEAVPVLAYSLVLTGTFIAEPTELTVAGIRLTAGPGPTVAEPQPGAEGDAALIDAINGRGSLDEALAGADQGTVAKLGALARFFRS